MGGGWLGTDGGRGEQWSGASEAGHRWRPGLQCHPTRCPHQRRAAFAVGSGQWSRIALGPVEQVSGVDDGMAGVHDNTQRGAGPCHAGGDCGRRRRQSSNGGIATGQPTNPALNPLPRCTRPASRQGLCAAVAWRARRPSAAVAEASGMAIRSGPYPRPRLARVVTATSRVRCEDGRHACMHTRLRTLPRRRRLFNAARLLLRTVKAAAWRGVGVRVGQVISSLRCCS